MTDPSLIQRIRSINPTIDVREATVKDGAQFVKLFNTYYKRKTNTDYFKWQFFDSPAESRLFAAFDRQNLIGYYGVKLCRLSNGVSAGFLVDLLVDEMYRKRGVQYLLHDELLRYCESSNVSVVLSLPNASGNAALNAMGWRTIAKIDNLILEKAELRSKNVNSADSNGRKQLIEFVKNEEYVKWRFRNNPIYRYNEITINKNSHAVTKLFNDPVTKVMYGDIVDIKLNQPASFNSLFNKIVERMVENKVHALTTWALPHTEAFFYLNKIGFMSSPQERYFCIKLLDSSCAELEQIENWNLVQADAEIY